MENKLENKYVNVIKKDSFLDDKKLRDVVLEILPQVNIENEEDVKQILLNEFVNDVTEEEFDEITNNLEKYKSILIDFVNDKIKQIKNYGEGGVFETDPEFFEITVANKNFKVLIAKTDFEKEQGLQYVEELDSNEGMLFDYSEENPTELSFWMKDTSIPLDIIFINNKGEVIQVSKGEPLSEEPLICSGEPIIAVLEVNQNSGIKVGDKTELLDEEEAEDSLQIDPENDDDFDEAQFPELKPNTMYILGSDGTPQGELQGNERIFSRIHTRALIKKAKRAYASRRKKKEYEALCIALGKNMFKCLQIQSETPAEYVENSK